MSTPELADITTCTHCGQKFSSPRVQIIGEPTARLEQYLKALSKHLAEKHPELGQQMVQHGAAFMEMLFLRNFKTTDPELSEQQDRVRWQVHQQTLKCRYPDENLKGQANALARHIAICAASDVPESQERKDWIDHMDSAFTEMIAEAFTSIRDALEEPGKYPTLQKGAELITK
jgi:hypothetical protein